MFTISKDFEFSASHQLKGLVAGHKCGRVHGHNYKVRVTLRSQALNKDGFVRDYDELSVFKGYIDEVLDHRHLNDLFDFQPSAENLAEHFYRMCKKQWIETYMVEVSETPKTWAAFTDESYYVSDVS